MIYNILFCGYLLVIAVFMFIFIYKYSYIRSVLLAHQRLVKTAIHVITALIFIAPYFFAFFGIDFHDTPFHLYNIELLRIKENSMTFGAILIGYPLLLPFGFSVISSRIISVFCYQVAFAIPIWTYYHYEKAIIGYKDRVIILLAYCSTLMYYYIIFSYDMLTILFTSLVMSLLYVFSKTKTKQYVYFVGVFSAILITVRFPNIFIVGFVSLFIVYVNKDDWKTGVINLIRYVLVVSLLYFIVIYLSFGSITSFIDSISQLFSNTGTTDTRHSSSNMLSVIFKDLFQMLICVPMVLSVFLYGQSKNTIKKSAFESFVFAIVTIALLTYLWINYSGYNWMVAYYVSAAIFIIIVYNFKFRSFILGLAVLSIYFVSAIGSDTGLLRVNMVPCLAVLSLFAAKKHNNYFTIGLMLLPLIFLLPMKKIRNTFSDAGILSLNKTTSYEKVKGIYSRMDNIIYLNKGCADIEKYESLGYKIIPIGSSDRYVFDYILQAENPIKQPWNVDFNNAALISEIEKIRTEKVFIIIVDRNGDFDNSDIHNYFIANNIPYDKLMISNFQNVNR